MHVESPWWWLAAAAIPVYLWWFHRRSYARLAPWAQRAGLALRLAILLCIVAALSQPSWLRTRSSNHLVFAIDVSESVSEENIDAAVDQVDALAAEAFDSGRAQRVSVVAFGERAELVIPAVSEWHGWDEPALDLLRHRHFVTELRREQVAARSQEPSEVAGEDDPHGGKEAEGASDRLQRITEFRERIVGEETDLERALRLAVNCAPTEDNVTVYVLTDGSETRGDWRRSVDAFEAAGEPGRGVALHLVALDRPGKPEIAATQLLLPASVRVNQGFSGELKLSSTIKADVELRLFRDGFQVMQRQVALEPGQTSVPVPDLSYDSKGFHTVEAQIRPPEGSDTELKNNTVRSLVIVPGKARVLYVDGDESEASYLKSALELEGMDVETRPGAGVPRDLSDLLSFDAFILCDVPADHLSMRQMEMIRTYVRDFGGGFIMLGGDDSFGLGGYFQTPIEEILPVRMPIQKDLMRPSLALFLVIDKSGSMDGVKIDLAKRAAIATADAINPRDQIGLVGFDSESRVLLELTSALDRARISSSIAQLSAGGGTYMYPALQDALSRLQESNARRKHIIVLSDGQTQGFGYEDMAAAIAADGITLSTIGIGEGADMPLLEGMASIGGGRSYFTNDFQSIPQIFTREALRAANTMLVERLVQPVAIADDPALAEIDLDDLPLLTGYVATTPKAAADTILVSDAGDPLLATWRYGLGRTAVFTSEPKPRWAEDWLSWPQFARFFSQLVRSVTGSDLSEKMHVLCDHRAEDGRVVLTAEIQDSAGAFVTDASVTLLATDASGRQTALEVTPRGPGLYEARTEAIRYGQDQQFVWQVSRPVADSGAADGDGSMQPVAYGYSYAYSPEYRTLGPAEETLAAIAARAGASGGSRFSVGKAELEIGPAGGRTRVALWPVLLTAGLLLAPLDILCRRMG